jgi:DNA-binding NtrC family response regulator
MDVLLAEADTKVVSNVLADWSLDQATLHAVSTASELGAISSEHSFSTIFLSTNLWDLEGLESLSFLLENQPRAELILLCNPDEKEKAEKAIKRGASSFLLKSVSVEILENIALKTINRLQQKINHRELEDNLLEDLLGNSPEMKKVLRLVHKLSPSNSTVLITGESGSGKEFFANIIHRFSNRSDHPFIAVNCGAIPENIVESELFGVIKGAFTGAVANKKGLFEEADTGTLFLDEVGELPHSTQVKLLRFLENREIRRVGDTENRKIDVRIIAATNRNMHDSVQEGNFREDLYFRLNTFQLHLPPLRKRKATIPNLTKFFLGKFNKEVGKSVDSIEPSAQMAMASYDYPGNVRELSNIIEHAIVMSDNGIIQLEDLPEKLWRPSSAVYTQAALPASGANEIIPDESEPTKVESLADVEKKHILYALEKLGNNQTEVAKTLGISRSTLWRKLQEHKIK